MIVLAKLLSGLLVLISLAFVVSVTAIIFSDQLRTEATSFPHAIIALGCNLNHYALHLLVLAFLLLFLEIGLKRKVIQLAGHPDGFFDRWRKILVLEYKTSPLVYLVSTLSRGVLVLFFISQLSYLLNHCR